MTHEQASQKLQKELGWTPTQADLHVSGSACLGMLKLDEPKSATERAVNAMFSSQHSHGGMLTPRYAIAAIEAAGLRIVEK